MLLNLSFGYLNSFAARYCGPTSPYICHQHSKYIYSISKQLSGNRITSLYLHINRERVARIHSVHRLHVRPSDFLFHKSFTNSNNCSYYGNSNSHYHDVRKYTPTENKFVVSSLAAGLVVLGSLFDWESNSISDFELERCFDEAICVKKYVDCSNVIGDDWEQMIDKKELKMWRRPVASRGDYEYRAFVRFNDVRPDIFFKLQTELTYRTSWDKRSKSVEILDESEDHSNQIVRWIYQFPYPMYNREYVYVNRSRIDYKRNYMMKVSRSTTHPSCPCTPSLVRVDDYRSVLVVLPHSRFNSKGLDCLLTYYDYSQTALPFSCADYLASSGISSFLEEMRSLSLNIQKTDSVTDKQLLNDISDKS